MGAADYTATPILVDPNLHQGDPGLRADLMVFWDRRLTGHLSGCDYRLSHSSYNVYPKALWFVTAKPPK